MLLSENLIIFEHKVLHAVYSILESAIKDNVTGEDKFGINISQSEKASKAYITPIVLSLNLLDILLIETNSLIVFYLTENLYSHT